jgi:hypothetical protein
MKTRLRSYLSLLLLLAAMPLIPSGCSESPEPTPLDTSDTSPSSPPPAGSAVLDWGGTLHQIDVADLDGDGLQDLTLTAHVEGRTETFYQGPPRVFRASGPLEKVGFHPNGTLALPAVQGPSYLVVNAEGAGHLKTYRTQKDSPAAFVAEVTSPSPDYSVVIDWPHWGTTLAVIPKAGSEVRFLRGFDPASPEVAPVIRAQAGRKARERVRGLSVAHLAGRSEASVLATVPREGRLVTMSPDGQDAIRVQEISTFSSSAYVDQILAVDFDGDGDDDLFALGQQMPEAMLLSSEGGEKPKKRAFPISGGGAQSAQVSLDADGGLILWVSGQRTFVAMRWGKDRSREPDKRVFARSKRGWIRFAGGDLDGDGYQDLVLGSSIGSIPPTVIFGPLEAQIDAVGAWLSERD